MLIRKCCFTSGAETACLPSNYGIVPLSNHIREEWSQKPECLVFFGTKSRQEAATFTVTSCMTDVTSDHFYCMQDWLICFLLTTSWKTLQQLLGFVCWELFCNRCSKVYLEAHICTLKYNLQNPKACGQI